EGKGVVVEGPSQVSSLLVRRSSRQHLGGGSILSPLDVPLHIAGCHTRLMLKFRILSGRQPRSAVVPVISFLALNKNPRNECNQLIRS
ncbi:hypothetical protein HAX54_042684, partial [Datura stramonium]|nr:hypothetical protein [Datura stramonium]